MENKELFEENGGEKLEYIASLNDSDSHVKVLASLLSEHG